MADAVRGLLLLTLLVADLVDRSMLAVPLALKPLLADGYDALVIVMVKRHKIRAALSVSSGIELVLPQWLRTVVPVLAAEQGAHEVQIYLSTRPIWLVPGYQDEAARLVAAQVAQQTRRTIVTKQTLLRLLESIWAELGDTFFSTDVLSKFELDDRDRPIAAKLMKELVLDEFHCADQGSHSVTVAGRKTTAEKYRKPELPHGHVRVELRGKQDPGQTLVIYTALTRDGRYDDSLPHSLLVAVTSGCTYYGALEAAGTSAEFLWSKDTDYSSPTNLFEIPLRVGREVVVESFDCEGDRVEMTILSITAMRTFTAQGDEGEDDIDPGKQGND